MDRILRAAGATIEATYYSAGGDPTDPALPVTADVVDSAGVAIAGSPFATTTGGEGTRRFNLPVELDVLDVYDVTWTDDDGGKRFTQFEMVGGFLFTIAELQAYDADLADEVAYSPALIREIRDNVTERFEQVAHRSFVARGRRMKLDGSDEATLILPLFDPYVLVSAKVGGVALTAEELADVKVKSHGVLQWDGGTWTPGVENVEVLVEYGFRSAPSPIQRAAMRLARHVIKANSGQADERASAVITELGGFRLTLAGRDGPTGLPEVDAVLAQFGHSGRTSG